MFVVVTGKSIRASVLWCIGNNRDTLWFHFDKQWTLCGSFMIIISPNEKKLLKKKQQHRHALCPRCWQTPTKRKTEMLLQAAIIDRAENRTVKYYQRWKILLPVGDHHQTNTSAPNAAVHMYILKQTATTILLACNQPISVRATRSTSGSRPLAYSESRACHPERCKPP